MFARELLEPWRIKFTNTWLQYQKNLYIDKLDDLVNKYNNAYHRTIKMKPAHVKWCTNIDFEIKKIISKFLNLKLVIM